MVASTALSQKFFDLYPRIPERLELFPGLFSSTKFLNSEFSNSDFQIPSFQIQRFQIPNVQILTFPRILDRTAVPQEAIFCVGLEIILAFLVSWGTGKKISAKMR